MSSNGAGLSPLGEAGRAIYEERLRVSLEQDHLGEAVAIHVDTGDYAIGRTHGDAARALLTRHERDGRIVTLTIGPPTDADLRLGMRAAAHPMR